MCGVLSCEATVDASTPAEQVGRDARTTVLVVVLKAVALPPVDGLTVYLISSVCGATDEDGCFLRLASVDVEVLSRGANGLMHVVGA